MVSGVLGGEGDIPAYGDSLSRPPGRRKGFDPFAVAWHCRKNRWPVNVMRIPFRAKLIFRETSVRSVVIIWTLVSPGDETTAIFVAARSAGMAGVLKYWLEVENLHSSRHP